MNSSLTCLVLLALTVSFSVLSTEACSCVPPSMRHRNVGCKAEFMAVVKITGVTPSANSLHNQFSFELIDDRTPALAYHSSLTPVKTINSNSNSAACGVYLETNAVYLLKGGLSNDTVASIFLCSGSWKKLPHVPTQSESKALLDAFYVEQC